MDGESPREPSTSTYVIDAVADFALRLRTATPSELTCDVCDQVIEGEPSGHGLYVWTRGEELRHEEPALCADCATAIGISALSLWSAEEEEG